MTVTLAYAPDQYTGTGANTPLATTFPFDDSSEIVVTSRVIATGAETTLVENTHYTVAGGAGLVGTITPIDGATDFPATVTWTLARETPLTQETNYVEGDIFPADAHEEVADKITRIVQESSYQANRALRFPDTDDSALDATLPSSVDRANMSLGFDADGEPIALAGTVSGDVTVTGFMETVLDDGSADDARATLVAQEDVVTTRGDIVVGDATPEAARLALGASGEVLTSDGTDADWAEVPFPEGYIFGLVMSNDDGPLGDDINVETGQCRDAANTVNIALSAETTKQTDAIWDTGDDAGGMPNGLLAASTWYRVFVIMNPTTGDVEVGFDTSATAANLIADHTGSGGGDASGYTKYRQIGWILTNATPHVLDFVQHGETFLWTTPVLDVTIADLDETAQTFAINAPPDCWAMINAMVLDTTGNAAYVYLSSTDQDDQAANPAAAPGVSCDEGDYDAQKWIFTDASSEIRAVSDDPGIVSYTGIKVSTQAYIYDRGRAL